MLPNPKPYFDKVPDPRKETENKLHALSDILSITLCAVLSGADDWEAVEEFGHGKEEWLRQFLPLENGIPSHDTFGRVFSLIDPEKFEDAFVGWTKDAQIGTGGIGEHIAVDGKTVRRSHRGAAGKALHLVHAWASRAGVVIGQRKVESHANEITAIPDVLSLFDLKGVTVTIDAIGCQKDIAEQIVDGGGDYVLALKKNQKTLHEDVQLFLDDKAGGLPAGDWMTIEKDHGRIETRRLWVSEDLDWLQQKEDWPGLRSVILVEAVRETAGKATTERRYYLSSLPPDPERLCRTIRAHWGIENCLHWVLDMAFNEDQSRARAGHSAENLAIIRRFAFNLLRQTKISKRGIKNKRLRAACDDSFRAAILSLHCVS
ncbi:MAG: ISAs1 family transposase [Nitrospirales bacterium]|nr:ISAs1 family transposase [Nitrospirales bacterium]